MINLLTKRPVAERVGWHPEHVLREARAGRFPKRTLVPDSEAKAWQERKARASE